MPSHSLPAVASRRAGIRVTKTEELALPLTNYSNWESRPCTLPGQNSRAGPGGVDVDELKPQT